MKRYAVALALVLGTLPLAADQFRNLGFEEANTNTSTLYPQSGGLFPYLAGFGPVADLLPGWQLSYGTSSQSQMSFNSDSWPFASSAGILESSFRILGFPITGNYALELSIAPSPRGEPISISQTGLIPPDAQFLTWTQSLSSVDLTASVNGTDLTFAGGDRLRNPYFDVSQFAGQEVSLSILYNYRGVLGASVVIDKIEFMTIPEPTFWQLSGFGSAGTLLSYGLSRWRRLRSR